FFSVRRRNPTRVETFLFFYLVWRKRKPPPPHVGRVVYRNISLGILISYRTKLSSKLWYDTKLRTLEAIILPLLENISSGFSNLFIEMSLVFFLIFWLAS
ncbi:unnamed protein product, partial [Musa textilis]